MTPETVNQTNQDLLRSMQAAIGPVTQQDIRQQMLTVTTASGNAGVSPQIRLPSIAAGCNIRWSTGTNSITTNGVSGLYTNYGTVTLLSDTDTSGISDLFPTYTSSGNDQIRIYPATASNVLYWAGDGIQIADAWNPLNRQVTPEERQALAQREAEWAARAAEERQLREAAEARANLLLGQHLTAEQRECLRLRDYFHVRSQHLNLYRIHRGRSMNVRQLDRHGKVQDVLCAFPRDVPDGDAMLVQKLMLETAEDQFLSIAISHGARAAGFLHAADMDAAEIIRIAEAGVQQRVAVAA